MLKLHLSFFSTSQLTLNIFSCAFECGKNARVKTALIFLKITNGAFQRHFITALVSNIHYQAVHLCWRMYSDLCFFFLSNSLTRHALSISDWAACKKKKKSLTPVD